MSYSAQVDYWFDETQLAIGKWSRHNFPSSDIVMSTLGIAEEVGELCRAVLKRAQAVRGTRAEWTIEMRKEMGDVLIKLFQIADLEDVDLLDIFRRRWSEVQQRDFQKDQIGHGLPKE